MTNDMDLLHTLVKSKLLKDLLTNQARDFISVDNVPGIGIDAKQEFTGSNYPHFPLFQTPPLSGQESEKVFGDSHPYGYQECKFEA